MKVFIFILVYCLILFKNGIAQNSTVCKDAQLIIQTVEKHHYSPRLIDSSYSADVYDRFIRTLDPGYSYLSKEDLGQLNAFKYNLHQDIQNENCEFVLLATQLYQEQIAFIDSLIQSFAKIDLNLNREDTIIFVRESNPVEKDDLVIMWQKRLHYEVFSEYFSLADYNTSTDQPDLQLLDSLKAAYVDSELCRLTSKFEGDSDLQEFIEDSFLKAVSFGFDPHTVYFNESDRQSFKTQLSRESRSFGLSIDKNDLGEIIIVQIIPASPAWKSQQFKEGDVINSITMENNEVIDFRCISLQDAYQALMSHEIDKAVFSISSQQGEETEVELVKARLDTEKNIIDTHILSGSSTIGYINLPSFYSSIDFSFLRTKGCAEDMAKELIRLENENIDGIILDLRGNTGGYMHEAMLLAGSFIDYGPIYIYEHRDVKPTTIKDINRGFVYAGPLVILVDNFTASASEVVASTLQDHDRAVIVGSRTFGKATSQQVLPLGNNNKYLKITSSKLFRVNKESHQKTGVIPDIVLPALTDSLNLGERMYATALDSSRIEKNLYFTFTNDLPISELQNRSNERIEADSTWQLFTNPYLQSILKGKGYKIPLSFQAFGQYEPPPGWKELTQYVESNPEPVFHVEYTEYETFFNNLNELSEETLESAKEKIASDIYIIESYHILQDLIEINQN